MNAAVLPLSLSEGGMAGWESDISTYPLFFQLYNLKNFKTIVQRWIKQWSERLKAAQRAEWYVC